MYSKVSRISESLTLDGANQIGSLQQLANLKLLRLVGTSSIERGAFDGLANLEALYLWDNQISSIEPGAFDGLTNLEKLFLDGNQISSIKPGAFDGLTNLEELFLDFNQISSIEPGAFDGLTNLESLDLAFNQITSLDLTGARFEALRPCFLSIGFCVDTLDEIILDDAKLSLGSYYAIFDSNLYSRVSIDGLTFNDEYPEDMSLLLGTGTFVFTREVTVGPELYERYSDEFDAFAARESKTLVIVVPDCNGDGQISIVDANCTADWKLDRFLAEHGTLPGDMDGLTGVDFADFLTLSGNFGVAEAAYTDGDLNLDGNVGFADFLILSANFGQGGEFGGEVASVPEPDSLTVLLLAILALGYRRFNRVTSGA